MKKVVVGISMIVMVMFAGCEMKAMQKEPVAERSMSIAGSPVNEKDYVLNQDKLTAANQ